MNNFLRTAILFVVVALAISTFAQDQGQCGCAPQPTIIQLSCGGGSQRPQYPPAGGHPPARATPPPPAPAPAPDASTVYPVDDDELKCEFDDEGYPSSSPPGGWPEGFRVLPLDCKRGPDCKPKVLLWDQDLQERLNNWDGFFKNLGFTTQPDTALDNAIKCWPVVTGYGVDHDWIQIHPAKEFNSWFDDENVAA